MSDRFELPPRTDLSGANALATALRARSDAPLTLGAAAVEQISTPGLQVLLSAARSWRQTGQPLRLDSPSAALTAQLVLVGLTVGDLESAGAEEADNR